MCVWRGIEQGRVSTWRSSGVSCALRAIFYTLAFSWFRTEWYSLIHGLTFDEYSLVSMSQNVVLVTHLQVRKYACDYFACLLLPSKHHTKSFAPPTAVVFLQTLSLSYTLFESSYQHVFSRSIVRRLPCLFWLWLSLKTATAADVQETPKDAWVLSIPIYL
jgi:hypothetical protein